MYRSAESFVCFSSASSSLIQKFPFSCQYGCQMVSSLLYTLSFFSNFPTTTFRLVQFKLYSQFKFNLNPKSTFFSPFFVSTFQEDILSDLTDSLKNFCTWFSLKCHLGFSALLWSPSHSLLSVDFPQTSSWDLQFLALPFRKTIGFFCVRGTVFFWTAFWHSWLSYWTTCTRLNSSHTVQ